MKEEKKQLMLQKYKKSWQYYEHLSWQQTGQLRRNKQVLETYKLPRLKKQRILLQVKLHL